MEPPTWMGTSHAPSIAFRHSGQHSCFPQCPKPTNKSLLPPVTSNLDLNLPCLAFSCTPHSISAFPDCNLAALRFHTVSQTSITHCQSMGVTHSSIYGQGPGRMDVSDTVPTRTQTPGLDCPVQPFTNSLGPSWHVFTASNPRAPRWSGTLCPVLCP